MGKEAEAPDVSSQIEAQARANRLNQITPYGNLQYGKIDENGVFQPNTDREEVRVNLSPERQLLSNLTQEQARLRLNERPFFTPGQLQLALPQAHALADNLPDTFSAGDIRSGLPSGASLSDLTGFRDVGQMESALPSAPGMDFADQNRRAADATFESGMGYLQPIFDTQRRRTVTDLDARGLPVGGEAYSGELDRLESSQGQQRNQLALASILAGNNEAGRLFDQGIRGRQSELGVQSGLSSLASGQRSQQYAEQEGLRQNRLNEGLGLAGLSEAQRQGRLNEQLAEFDAALRKQGFLTGLEQQNAQLGAALASGDPMFINPSGIDAAGLMQQNYANQQKQQQNQANNLLGLGNLGVAAFTAFSDRELKDNILKVDEMDGINVYEFSYKGSPERYRGVIAQEVMHIPDAVIAIDGYLAVNYDLLPVKFERIS